MKKNGKEQKKMVEITLSITNWMLKSMVILIRRHDYCKLRHIGAHLTAQYKITTNIQQQNMDNKRTGRKRQGRKKHRPRSRRVAIMLSNRMADKLIDEGHVGTRIAWARISGPVCNIFFIVTYIPHKGRTCPPYVQDTIKQLKKLLQIVCKSDCVILTGDFNCQLQRNIQGCTGKWSAHD